MQFYISWAIVVLRLSLVLEVINYPLLA